MKKIYLVLFVILSIFVFSCKDNLISDDLSSNQNSGAGQVKVFVKQSRLIGPELSDVSWDVKLQKSGENNTISGKNENGYYLFSGLSDGTYTITVFGKIDEVEKFTGSAKVTITNGNSVSVNVPIVAQKGTADVVGTGYATITMDMSEELLSKMGEKVFFQAKLVGADTNIYIASFVDEENQILLDNQQITFAYTDFSSQTTDIPAGYYNLSFVGLEEVGYSIKLKDNLVEIGDGLTTNIVITQNDYELVEELSESQIFYVDNSDNDHEYDDSLGISTPAGLSLSNPLGFRNINDNISGTFYLISDVEAYKEGENSFFEIDGEENTITSFGSKIFSITNNISDSFVSLYSTTLKNIKLTNTTGAGFKLNWCSVDGTVILDTPIAKNLDLDSDSDSVVNLYKSSKLVIGQKFSGELGICLSFEDWNIGDTVVTFENGVKPSNSNFYISEDADMPTDFASMFYIDDKGKLAQYDATSQWVNFAWNSGEPCLITQTQAKNKTYTSIYDNDGYPLYDFNGISTYDEENQTWYFINNSALYSVTNPKNYEGVVEASLISIDDNLVTLSSITAMDYDDGKLYMGYYNAEGYQFYIIEVGSKTVLYDGWFSLNIEDENYRTSDLTSMLVDEDFVYIATTLTDTTQQNVSTTHSAIWQLTLELTENGYMLSPAQTYPDDSGAEYPVPYYQTSSDDDLKVGGSFPEKSTFRITDLYSDGNSVYGLLANYIEKEGVRSVDSNDKNKSFMRGSVFKLEQNTSRQKNSSVPIMNATHLGLRNSFPLTTADLATAKKYFILPRKIVGILNKKLVIVDDGMVPDSNDCNVDRFALFDLFNLADEISETIDVAVPFSTNGVANTSDSLFYTINFLFN